MNDRGFVLLVEDDVDVRALTQQVLVGAGFTVRTAPSGPAALALLEESDELPAVIVLDVQMPDLDGWSTLERIRTDPRFQGVRVLMCTVKTLAEDEDRARVLRPDGYLSKPFAIDALEAAVERLAGFPAGASF